MNTSFRRHFSSSDSDEEGSAVVEFVLIALPLFLPAMLFFSALHSTARTEIDLSNLARQSLRAFITSEDLSTGHQRVKFVLDKFRQIDSGNGFTYNISCGSEKCLTPGSLVKIELYREFNAEVDRTRKAVAVAQGYVDKWRSEDGG
jgi:hypothetical protein